MNNKELYNKKIKPILNEMYVNASNILGITQPLTIDIIEECAVQIDDKKCFPFYAFYMSCEEQEKIIDKYCKRLPKIYVWNKQQPNEQEQFKKYCDDLHKLAIESHGNDKLYNKQYKELCKSYNMILRSKQREIVEFNVYNLSPNTNIEYVNKLRDLFINGVTEDTSDNDKMQYFIMSNFKQNIEKYYVNIQKKK